MDGTRLSSNDTLTRSLDVHPEQVRQHRVFSHMILYFSNWNFGAIQDDWMVSQKTLPPPTPADHTTSNIAAGWHLSSHSRAGLLSPLSRRKLPRLHLTCLFSCHVRFLLCSPAWRPDKLTSISLVMALVVVCPSVTTHMATLS